MGIQLSGIVHGQEISLEDLLDKKIAIDAFNWIYQFLSIIRQPDGEPLKDSAGRITSHLSGLYYRTLKLMEAGVRPIYVFDGEPPEFKAATAEKRRDVRAEAAREWKQALERKDYVAAKKHAQRAATITDEIIAGSKELLEAMGVPVVQAPSEGEALCSLMAKEGDAYAVATQDYDSLLFGAPRLVRNLSITGRKKRGTSSVVINPEMIKLADTLEELGITHEQLVMLGILVGTDYNPGGVPGYGPKKALELVKAKRTFSAVFGDVAWTFETSPEEIFDFFLKPKAGNYDITFGEPDETEIKKILCDRHDFSEERIGNALARLREKRGDQSSLSRWAK